MAKFCSIVMVAISVFPVCMYAQEDEVPCKQHPFEWNLEQIKRAHEAWQKGEPDQVASTLEQAYRKVQQERAKTELDVWIREYHPWIPYVASAIAGAFFVLQIQQCFVVTKKHVL